MSKRTNEHQHAGHAEKSGGTALKPVPARQKVSDEERSRLIHVGAYGLWEQAGKPEGDAAREQFWCEAEQHVMVSHARDA